MIGYLPEEERREGIQAKGTARKSRRGKLWGVRSVQGAIRRVPVTSDTRRRRVLLTTGMSFCTPKHLCASFMACLCPPRASSPPQVTACMRFICHSKGVRMSHPVNPRGTWALSHKDAVGTEEWLWLGERNQGTMVGVLADITAANSYAQRRQDPGASPRGGAAGWGGASSGHSPCAGPALPGPSCGWSSLTCLGLTVLIWKMAL